MRTWTRVVYREKCGRCGALLVEGTPIQTVSLEHTKRMLIRCGACADGPTPPDLPENIKHYSVTELSQQRITLTPMKRLGDFKAPEPETRKSYLPHPDD